MQHEVTSPIRLLDTKGRIAEEGWARHPIWMYDRKSIHASALRIKEWDYYAIMSHRRQFAVTATVSDLGYGALFAVAFIDFTRGKSAQQDAMKFFTFGKTGLSPSSFEDNSVTWANKQLRLTFVKKGSRRHLMFAAPKLVLPDGSVGLDVDVTLTQPEDMESMNIATSWQENRKAFYLNEKVNCMPAEGRVRTGYDEVQLQQDEAFGVLDWGRGRWTYTNRWYWGSASGLVENVPFGFNIGYGFSDRTPASENVLFYDNKVHKLEEVLFHIPENDYTEPWKFSSSDGRFELDFQPAVDRSSTTNFGIIKSIQHQVFGWFSGTVILDDGTALTLDKFPGFAEDVFNRW
ncbi:MAG: DUF2804 domain-containing protein [Sphaerochaetaceae bacterium]|nr:DUF2804 domain-containing protein [Sphaerochaetaceae bacterium]